MAEGTAYTTPAPALEPASFGWGKEGTEIDPVAPALEPSRLGWGREGTEIDPVAPALEPSRLGWGREGTVLAPPGPACPEAEIASIQPIDPRHLVVTFDAPVRRNGALAAPANYKIAPALAVRSVATGAGASTLTVTLETDEMLDGGAYQLEIETVELA